MPSRNESTFIISVADLDVSLLPAHARTPGTDAFRAAVTELVRSEYAGLGGRARIVIDDKAEMIQVTWRSGAGQPDPLDVAVGKLQRGQYQEAIRLLEMLRFER